MITASIREAMEQIRADIDAASKREQLLRERYLAARVKVDKARIDVQEAEKQRRIAKKRMTNACKPGGSVGRRKHRIWRDFENMQKHTVALIDGLRIEAEEEARLMEECANNAAEAHAVGDEIAAADWLREQYAHEEVCAGIEVEITDLEQDIESAREQAEIAEKISPERKELRDLEEEFRMAKIGHSSALRELKHTKAERNRLKKGYKTAKADCSRLKRQLRQATEALSAQPE